MLERTHLELTLLGRPSLRVVKSGHVTDATVTAVAGAEVTVTEVTLPTRKSLALVAYLALNGTTGRSELSSLLWGGNTDAEARKNLRQDVYRLQSTPVGPWLVADRHRLGLLGEVQVDARRLMQAAALGDLEGVIALHRGPLLDGLSLPGAEEFEAWLETERERLVRLYREALNAHAQHLEARDDLRGALQALERLVIHDPLQEATQRELMRLHWQLGERPQALERFVHLETLLREEMGLEPATETLNLAQQIRSARPAVVPAPVPGVSRQTALELPFVGRADAWTWLEAQTGLALLTGEPGIGKTRLALEFARAQMAGSDDARLLHLRGFETFNGTPYYPITSALLEHFERFPEGFDALRPAWRREVERLLPGHDGRTREPPPAEGRGWFLEGLAQTLVALAGATGCLLLDDLHWFDAHSLEVVRHLTRRAPGLRLIGTLRSDELVAPGLGSGSSNGADIRVAGLGLDALSNSRLELAPLVKTEVLTLFHHLAGPHSEGLIGCVLKVFETTGGNPLFLSETLRDALDSGALGLDGDGWLMETQAHLPPVSIVSGVRETINRRIERLGPRLKRLLEAASLLEGSFNLETVSIATEISSWEALNALDAAVELHLLENCSQGYRFVQAVTRNALREGLGDQRSALLHSRLARALRSVPGNATQIAGHFEWAGEPLAAIPHWMRAGQEAALAFAYREALNAYDQALAAGADAKQTLEIRTVRVKLLEYLDDRGAWALELERLEALALGEHDVRVGGRVNLCRAEFEFHHGRYEATIQALNDVIDRDDLDLHLRVAALHRAGMALVRLGRLDAAQVLLTRALEIAPVHDLERCAAIQHALSITAFHGGQLTLALHHNATALRSFQTINDERGQAMVLSFAGRLKASLGQPEASLEALQRALGLARGSGFIPLLRSTLLNVAAALLNNGDFADAQRYLDEGAALGQEPQDPRMAGLYLTHSSAAYRARGELGNTLAAYREALALFDGAHAMHPAAFERLSLIELLLESGLAEEAQTTLRTAGRLIETHGFSDLRVWLTALELRLAVGRGGHVNLGPLQVALREATPLRVEIRQEALLALAEGQCHAGQLNAALDTAATVRHPPESRARGLTTLLRTRAEQGLASAGEINEAHTLLASARVTPLAKLGLRCALTGALELRGEARLAEAARAQSRRLMEQLALSLDAAARAGFLAHWGRFTMLEPRLEAAD